MSDLGRTAPEDQKKAKTKISQLAWPRTLLVVLGVVIIFGLGYGLGSGKINFGLQPSNSNRNLSSSLDFSSVDEAYRVLRNTFDGELDSQKLEEGLKRGLAEATGDPYTEFFNAEEAKAFAGDLNGSFEGIGAELGKQNGQIVVISPLQGFPAQKAGLKSKDVIVKINGEPASDLSITEAVKKIRGPKGSEVTLTVQRGDQQQEIKIKRDTISTPSVEYKKEGNIGYIKITRFGDDTVALARQAAKELKNQGVKGVILDLRSNPGGFLSGSVDIASLWLKKGDKVVEERRGGEVLRTHLAGDNNTLAGMPTIVLINEGSASASEIVAGALKDNGVAKLVGAKTFGKGSVQQIENLRNGSALKVTIARWFTPAGSNIDKEGIKPDYEIEFTQEASDSGQDPQKTKAVDLLNQ